HGADLTRALRFGALQHDHVPVFDAVCHGIAADAQSELIGAAPQRQATIGIGVAADRYAGGDLAEERYTRGVAQQRQLRTTTPPPTFQAQLALGLERTQVFAQGGIADIEGAGQGRELRRSAGALVGPAQGFEDLQLAYWPWRHGCSFRYPLIIRVTKG